MPNLHTGLVTLILHSPRVCRGLSISFWFLIKEICLWIIAELVCFLRDGGFRASYSTIFLARVSAFIFFFLILFSPKFFLFFLSDSDSYFRSFVIVPQVLEALFIFLVHFSLFYMLSNFCWSVLKFTDSVPCHLHFTYRPIKYGFLLLLLLVGLFIIFFSSHIFICFLLLLFIFWYFLLFSFFKIICNWLLKQYYHSYFKIC